MVTSVVAQGTFDILHPGHVHYFREAASMGTELHVIVARCDNISHKDPPILSAQQRRDVVEAVDAVDHARIGHPEDILVPIEEIDPDVIVLGHDQHHDEETLRSRLAERGIDCRIERASPRKPAHNDEILSTRAIIERVLQRRG